MTLTLTAWDAGLRLLLTFVAGFALGLDRSIHGHPAGTRTTLLVALAACLAMLLANALMMTVGKAPDSFISLDVMRLPLGVLTGVGFIGGGAILKRGDSVVGLTTAATLWFVTVMGLCFGAGQLALGVVGAALGIVVLRVLKYAELRLSLARPVELTIAWREGDFNLNAAVATIGSAGLRLRKLDLRHNVSERVEELRCIVERRGSPEDHSIPPALAQLSQRAGVLAWEWKE
jgi:putative Mg2+ transporter-C (MgtC) family protein